MSPRRIVSYAAVWDFVSHFIILSNKAMQLLKAAF